MSEAAKWYIIHTYSGYENKVKQDIEKVVENRKLHDLILEVQVPTETVTEITDGKTKELERKLFPGYVFLKMGFGKIFLPKNFVLFLIRRMFSTKKLSRK